MFSDCMHLLDRQRRAASHFANRYLEKVGVALYSFISSSLGTFHHHREWHEIQCGAFTSVEEVFCFLGFLLSTIHVI